MQMCLVHSFLSGACSLLVSVYDFRAWASGVPSSSADLFLAADAGARDLRPSSPCCRGWGLSSVSPVRTSRSLKPLLWWGFFMGKEGTALQLSHSFQVGFSSLAYASCRPRQDVTCLARSWGDGDVNVDKTAGRLCSWPCQSCRSQQWRLGFQPQGCYTGHACVWTPPTQLRWGKHRVLPERQEDHRGSPSWHTRFGLCRPSWKASGNCPNILESLQSQTCVCWKQCYRKSHRKYKKKGKM